MLLNAGPIKAALYARVSTDDKGQDNLNQLVKLREFAANRRFESAVEFVDTASAANDNRPGLDKMLKAAKKHEFDIIVIVRLDRMMRSVQNTIKIIKDLDRWKVELFVLDQNIDFGTASGRLQYEVLAAVAEFERELIRDRTIDGLNRARRQGKKLGRPRVSDEKASERTRQRRNAAAKKGDPDAL